MKPKIAIKSKNRISLDMLKLLREQLEPLKKEVDFIVLDHQFEIEVIPQVSVREYFIGQAMSGLIASGKELTGFNIYEENCRMSITMADAMIQYMKAQENEDERK